MNLTRVAENSYISFNFSSSYAHYVLYKHSGHRTLALVIKYCFLPAYCIHTKLFGCQYISALIVSPATARINSHLVVISFYVRTYFLNFCIVVAVECLRFCWEYAGIGILFHGANNQGVKCISDLIVKG